MTMENGLQIVAHDAAIPTPESDVVQAARMYAAADYDVTRAAEAVETAAAHLRECVSRRDEARALLQSVMPASTPERSPKKVTLPEEGSKLRRVYDALSTTPQALRTIAHRSNMTSGDASSFLSHLAERGLVVRVSPSVWSRR